MKSRRSRYSSEWSCRQFRFFTAEGAEELANLSGQAFGHQAWYALRSLRTLR
jgi:hypothetical protein